MKKIVSVLLFSAAILVASTPAKCQQTMLNSVDTLTNAVTAYTTLQVFTPVDLLTISYALTKISGTVAGIAIPQASIDGTNYVNISTDTLTLANQATNAKIWPFTKAPYKYYRIKTTTSGTQSSSQAAKLFTRQPPK